MARNEIGFFEKMWYRYPKDKSTKKPIKAAERLNTMVQTYVRDDVSRKCIPLTEFIFPGGDDKSDEHGQVYTEMPLNTTHPQTPVTHISSELLASGPLPRKAITVPTGMSIPGILSASNTAADKRWLCPVVLLDKLLG